ncbi:MAG TPA: hypothetical protein VIU10_02510 [Candidatus Udaeobacter sp.]
MNATEQNEWLAEHIPHRFRACIACLPFQEECMPQSADEGTRQIIRDLLVRTAAFEGRLVAMRWLIEFVGVGERNKAGKVCRPRRKPNDVSIEMIEGGKEIDLDSNDAEILANVRKGCTQASAHPTRDTNHPRVNAPELDEALRIIVKHLNHTVYSGRPRDLLTETFSREQAFAVFHQR